MALTHGVYTVFMVNAAKKTVYTRPWVNAIYKNWVIEKDF